MSNRTIKDELPACAAPVLTDALLRRLYELNLDFLHLLRDERAQPQRSAQLQHFTPKFLERFPAIGEDALRRIARVPYTLYSLGFEDLNFWQASCDAHQEMAARYCTNSAAWLQGPFYEVALLFAWHVASSSRLAARVMLAMPDSLIRLFTQVPLSQVRRIAIDYPGLLMPRWPTNASFWPGLMSFAQENDRSRLNNVKLLGTQLIATQLQAAEGHDQRLLSAHRLQYAARVRSGKLRIKLAVES